MPQTIIRSFRDLVAEADAAVRTLDVSEAVALHGREDVVFIDLRDIREVARTGIVAGAHHVPRGMLEFWIDPESPYHKPVFAEDKTFVFYCAGGWRSALAGHGAPPGGPSAGRDGGRDRGGRARRPAEGAEEPLTGHCTGDGQLAGAGFRSAAGGVM